MMSKFFVDKLIASRRLENQSHICNHVVSKQVIIPLILKHVSKKPKQLQNTAKPLAKLKQNFFQNLDKTLFKFSKHCNNSKTYLLHLTFTTSIKCSRCVTDSLLIASCDICLPFESKHQSSSKIYIVTTFP